MRFAQLGLLLFSLPLNITAWGQQAQPVPSVPSATKDAQALDLVTQALAAAGGVRAITAIVDYTATGNITYPLVADHDVKGIVTVRGKGLGQFRLDTNLPFGQRSEATDGLTTIKTENGSIHQLDTQAPLAAARLALPYLELKAALTSRGLTLEYKGIVDVDGHHAHDIQVQHIAPGAPDRFRVVSWHLTTDYFIDASTFQIVMMQDVTPKRVIRQVRYSDFRVSNGLLIPFVINVRINGQETWVIDLTEITFNSGLQDSDFQLK
jgi:hypothetical protein